MIVDTLPVLEYFKYKCGDVLLRLHLSLILNNTKFKHPVGIQPVGQKIVCFLNHRYIDAIAVLVLIIALFFFFFCEDVLKICPC